MKNINYKLKGKNLSYVKLNSKMFILDSFEEFRISRKNDELQLKIEGDNVIFTATLSKEEIQKFNSFIEDILNNNESRLNTFKTNQQSFSIKKHTLIFSEENGFSFWLNVDSFENFIDFDLFIDLINQKILN